MEKRLLIIGMVWPEPTSSAAGWRMIHLIDLFLEQGYQIHFACAASKSPYSFPLDEKGITEQHIELNHSSFNAYIKELNPEIVLFDRFMIEEQYSWRVVEMCPDAVRILDTEDLHFLRHAREEAYKRKEDFNEDLLYNELTKRELSAILRSDLSIIISSYEEKLLTERFAISKEILIHLPFQVNADLHLNKQQAIFEERSNFVFIGNFLHEPNWKTVQELKKIWPEIRKALPKVELHIYGAYPSQKVLQLNNPKEGFCIKGRADDAIETIAKYRVLLAPIPFGAGLKGKFIDALYAKTPSVSSYIGVEGMRIDGDWNGFVAEGPQETIQKAILLYSQQKIWLKAVETGEKILVNMSKTNRIADFYIQLKKISTHLVQHRNRHFIGQILWSKQFAASKYLSLWIEQKNN